MIKLCYSVQTRPNENSGWLTIARFINAGDALFFAGLKVTVDRLYARVRCGGKTDMSWVPKDKE